MIGGGKWNKQNKILNGAYINFISKKKTSKIKHIIPDDPIPDTPDVPVVSDTSSVLGIAALGRMVLGNTSSGGSSITTTSVLGVAKLGQMILV